MCWGVCSVRLTLAPVAMMSFSYEIVLPDSAVKVLDERSTLLMCVLVL